MARWLVANAGCLQPRRLDTKLDAGLDTKLDAGSIDASMPGLRTGQLRDRTSQHFTWEMGQQGPALHRHFADVLRVSAQMVTHVSRRFRRRYACVALVVTHVSRTFVVSGGFTDVSRVFRGVRSMRYARFTNVSQAFRGQYTLCL